ncbi:hypothetical protein [Compostimonas suwonensis]|uniref:ABC-2 type transport system permease protein n=1 Tax=Compostimonas suwonensis TaxID=1048394 RepID=A0A2M9BWM7_9MICO|nr:hypothetical protein [Compostimonas suwonensis]PJJ62357.1 ABC-2 type transport system permease protein [Compostimonas suwonensis]
MVAQFLGLKLRQIGGTFRRSVWQSVGVIVAIVAGLALVTVLAANLVDLRDVAVGTVGTALTVAGSVVVLGFTVIPLFFGSSDTMDPRGFALFGIPNRTLALGLLVSAFIGIPVLLLAVVALATVVAWGRGFGEVVFAILGAVVGVVTCVVLSRVTTSLAALGLSASRWRDILRVLGTVLLFVVALVLVVLMTVDWSARAVGSLDDLAEILGWTPLGAAWSMPAAAAAGDYGGAFLKLLESVAVVVVLWFAWRGLVARMIVTPGREARVRSYAGLGWFGAFPSTPTGTIAARSLTYWARDPRYGVSLVALPILPIFMIAALTLAGVPWPVIALTPLPLICVFLGWTMHNDVAYDSTAIWLHVASGTRGFSDRVGRIIPVLLVGIPIIVALAFASIALNGDWRLLPSMLGVCASLFLSGLGFASFTSARFPYPATQPGESPFSAPQASGTAAAAVQSLSFIGSIAVSIPVFMLAWMGVDDDPSWHLVALGAGVGIGLVVLVGGVAWGSWVFNRRGPEMLAAAIRA